MRLLRNFIDVLGITNENELPTITNGQQIIYSDTDYIFVPENKPKVKDLYQISVNVDITSTRVINSGSDKIVVVDALKKLKIVYTQADNNEKASILTLELPYNTFFQAEKGSNGFEEVHIYIADAYFEVIEGNKIYNHMLYFLEISKQKNLKNISKFTKSNNVNEITKAYYSEISLDVIENDRYTGSIPLEDELECEYL